MMRPFLIAPLRSTDSSVSLIIASSLSSTNVYVLISVSFHHRVVCSPVEESASTQDHKPRSKPLTLLVYLARYVMVDESMGYQDNLLLRPISDKATELRSSSKERLGIQRKLAFMLVPPIFHVLEVDMIGKPLL